MLWFEAALEQTVELICSVFILSASTGDMTPRINYLIVAVFSSRSLLIDFFSLATVNHSP
jgi:hypothetical protein